MRRCKVEEWDICEIDVHVSYSLLSWDLVHWWLSCGILCVCVCIGIIYFDLDSMRIDPWIWGLFFCLFVMNHVGRSWFWTLLLLFGDIILPCLWMWYPNWKWIIIDSCFICSWICLPILSTMAVSKVIPLRFYYIFFWITFECRCGEHTCRDGRGEDSRFYFRL